MATTPDDTVELRFIAPRLIVDLLDAVSSARRISRAEMANRVLERWAREVLHQQMIVGNVTRGNPALTEPKWNDTEV